MDPTRTIPASSGQLDVTRGLAAGGRPNPVRRTGPVTLVTGATSPADVELRQFLRRRLRVLLMLTAAGFAVHPTLGLFVPSRPPGAPGPPGGVDLVLVLQLTVVGVGVAGLILLRNPEPPSIRRLRGIELALVGAVFACNALDNWQGVSAFAREGPWVRLDGRLAHSQSFLNVLLIVGYGVFVPNTWRRCLLVVGALASLSLAAPLAAAGWYGAPAPVVRGFAATMAVDLAAAVGLAVYGARQLSILRREVRDARRLGQYVLREKLGSGGMGGVYRAEHALLRRLAAIKLIRPEMAGDPATLARFEREVQATATLTHPNTVQIYDYGRAEDGTFYYVMEYLPGLPLDELVERSGPLPPRRAVHLLRQVCAALKEAHTIGLVHRDLKPGNVMVCDRGGLRDMAKLLDFGLVRSMGAAGDEKLTQEGAVFGTPAYLSPEQAAGQGEPDARSDVYSLGALAYFLLTGRPPFAGRSVVKLLAAHLYEPPEPPSAHRPGLPVDLEAVVLRCLAKPPGERFQSVEELDAALASCGAAEAR
jgi:serine/threonine-protein kinase